VVEFVVRAQGNQSAETDSVAVEDLGARVLPNCKITNAEFLFGNECIWKLPVTSVSFDMFGVK
jgi:hypothetical protein